MRGKFFLDTNILIYAIDSADPRKQEIALKLLAAARVGDAGWLSYQVVQEWLNVVLRKSAGRLSMAETGILYTNLIEPLSRMESSRDHITTALSLHGKEKLSWWDALIVSSALLARCERLLTEDLQHGQVIRGVRIEDPFR